MKLRDRPPKLMVKDQFLHEANQAIDTTSFHALPWITAEVGWWVKVNHLNHDCHLNQSQSCFQLVCVLYFVLASIIAFYTTCNEVSYCLRMPFG